MVRQLGPQDWWYPTGLTLELQADLMRHSSSQICPLGPQSLPLGLEFRIPSYEKLTKDVSERKGGQNRIEFLQLAN